MRRILSLPALLSVLLLAGCATAQKRGDTLTTTLNAYASAFENPLMHEARRLLGQ